MTPYKAALDNLAGLSPAGVARRYGVDALPEALSRAQLPALLVLPAKTGSAALPAPPGEGFQAAAFSGGAKAVSCGVTHLLLVAPAAAGRGARAHLPRLADLIDAYLAALAADPTLGGALLEPAAVRVEPGLYSYGGAAYYGCAFRHTWAIGL